MSPETNYKKPRSAGVIGLGYVGLPTAALLATRFVRGTRK